MKLRTLLVGIGALLIPNLAQAADHQWQSCASAFDAGTELTENPLVFKPGQKNAWCFDTSATDSSNLADFRKCEYLDVKVHSPDGGASANIDVSFFVCDTSESTNCTAITGIDNTATSWPNSFSAQYGYVDVVTNTGTNDVRTEVWCFGGHSNEGP